jgi:hypothetical protein
MKRFLIVPILLAGLVGCSTGEVKLGVDIAALKSVTVASVTNSLVAETTETADASLEISRVRLLIAHAKIGYTGGGKCSDSGGSAADAGPIVVDLTADEIAKGAHREFDLGSVASGTYGGAEIEIQPLDADATGDEAALADFRSAGASLLVDGTYQGNSFQFAGHFLAEQGTDSEVTVDASSPAVLAVSVDPSTWFLDTAGAALDPTDSAQHAALAVAICKTLDTQQPLASPEGDATAKPASADPRPDGHGRRGPDGKGHGQGAHCVEPAGE